MKQFIIDFPTQFQKGIEAAEAAHIKIEDNFENLVVCGMGGSALPAEILKMLPGLTLPVFIHRSYGLPRVVTEKSLIFISSYSGNTEETLDAFSEAKKRNLNIVGFSVGGKLEKMCLENKTTFVKYPKEAEGFQPRFALGYAFAAMLFLVCKLGFAPCDVEAKLIELAENLNKKMGDFETKGKALAQKSTGNIILVYTTEQLKYLAHIWKINFNETSKISAFWNYFPELNHNEIEGWVNAEKIAKNKFSVLMLRDSEGDERILKRMEITGRLLEQKGVKIINVHLEKGWILDKIFSSIILSLWTGYHLALLYDVDPVSVKIVEEFKKLIKE